MNVSLSQMFSRLGQFVGQHKTASIVVATTFTLVVLIYIPRLWRAFDAFRGLVDKAVRMGTVFDEEMREVVVRGWFSWVVVIIVVLVFITIVALLISLRQREVQNTKQGNEIRSLTGGVAELRKLAERLTKEKERVLAGRLKSEEIVKKTFDRMMMAAFKITQQTSEKHPKKEILEIENCYLISSDFAGNVVRRYKLRAVQPLNFWEIRISVESEASAQKFLDEINFKVRDANGEAMTYLPTENNPHLKKVAIFFLPQLQPGEETEVTVSYKWPGMFNKLKQDKFERGSWNLSRESAANIPLFKASIFLDTSVGKQLRCVVDGFPGGHQILAHAVHPQSGWHGFEYKIEDAPPEIYALRVELR